MSKEIDLTGQQFGEWTVLFKSNKKMKNRSTYWHCRCSCGTEKDVNGANLRNGASTNCGCKRKGQIKDLTNQRFGKLTVIKPTEQRQNQCVVWECKCDCGNITYVKSNSLLSGNTKSCGCLHKELLHELMVPDLIGQKFHHLTVVEKGEIDKHGKQLWKCKCDCGNPKDIFLTTTTLKSGNTQSCGCQKSKGENRIIELLTEYNIPFTQQKTFQDCIFPDTKGLARFDFYVNDTYLIEYDGIQHFAASKYEKSWNTQEKVEHTQSHDTIKNQWCKKHKIPLIRIPYTHLKDLCIEDLLLETSKFII